ncbi:MAG: winged-helix domain-containing protein, partial [Planctomycetia bacterium]
MTAKNSTHRSAGNDFGKTDAAIPKATVARLSLYLRQLEVLERRDETTVSSQRLGSAVNVTDAQVRKD